ncbi:MAG: two-component regulator propeller domain-containing protein [Mongoliitalea sp.]
MILKIFKGVIVGLLFWACGQSSSEVEILQLSGEVRDNVQRVMPRSTNVGDLPDSLQPKLIKLADMGKLQSFKIPRTEEESYFIKFEETKKLRILPPKVNLRPILVDDQGKAVLDKNGNPYNLGDGGLSHLTIFTTDNGLALDNITSSVLDTHGNLWFGTWGGGISKFDGMSFTNYTTTHGLANNLVHCITEDLNGNIWIGTDGGGVSRYDGLEFTTFNTSDGLADNLVYGVTVDSKGNIWIATGDGGVSKFNGASFVNYTQENGLPSNSIIKITEDKEGYLWFATGNSGLVRFDGNSFTEFTTANGLIDNKVNCLLVDSTGTLWIGTGGGGVSSYQSSDNKEKGTFTSYTIADGLGSNEIWDIIEDRDSNIWFATGIGGITKFDGQEFTTYTSSEGLPKSLIYSITEDRSGNLWIGTGGGGVVLFYGKAFSNFTMSQGLPENGVFSIVEDDFGNYWFGTNGAGLARFDGKTFTNYSTDQGLAHPLVISSLKDRKGNLWFGTGGGGLSFYQESNRVGAAGTFTTINTVNGLPSDVIYDIIEDSNGAIWLGTGGGGLVKLEGTSIFDPNASLTVFTTNHGLPSNIIYGLYEDSDGSIWLGTASGVSKFDGQSFTNYSTQEGLANEVVWSIIQDRIGRYWFATQGGGVSIFDGDSFTTFNRENGLSDNTVYDLVQDQQGVIFIGTNRGFTVIPAEAAMLPIPQIVNQIEYYSTNYGFPVKDVNKGMLLDSKGVLWAGNGSDLTGLVRFDYQELEKKKYKPIAKVKSISLDQEPISWYTLLVKESSREKNSLSQNGNELKIFGRILSPEERKEFQEKYAGITFSSISAFENIPINLSLPYLYNSITIDFATDELARPNLMEYSFLLEGYTKDWSPSSKKSSASFGNMWEGDYTFKVKARYIGPAEGEAGEWSDIVSYSFAVRPPWYRTWLAITLYAVILLFVFRVIHLFQKAKTIRRERERTQQRELEQAKQIEQAYQDLKATQAQLIHAEKMASLGELTAGIAHEIKNPLNFVKNFSEVSLELIEEVFKEMEKPTDSFLENTFVRENLEDIRFNLSKVIHHGSRANSIVTSMLQHSRGGNGQKELTDLNAMIKEYTNLSFHGMRAGKHPINVDIQYDLDTSIPQIEVVGEDFSRVIVNLCNNAFDALRMKIKEVEQGFEPRLIIRTRNQQGSVLIEVEDNGPGMSDDVRRKILQPFFTTKKGTEGTGLGLSISNDIIIAHGGSLQIESIPNEGSLFRITLTVT